MVLSLLVGAITGAASAAAKGVDEAAQIGGAGPLVTSCTGTLSAAMEGIHAGGQSLTENVGFGAIGDKIDGALQWAVNVTDSSGFTLGGGAQEKCAAALQGVDLGGLNLGNQPAVEHAAVDEPMGNCSVAQFAAMNRVSPAGMSV